ncbi:uncharacterized protein LOC114014426 [Falco cherrug]|uniref:uncharacterized protein LOC114014426 n=1 Tax=Falco cherrug TaxID=345164 RepID=UPI00247ABE98|nr:uncharacterized protein LOC114014426 [Falco cherrug]
MDQGHSSKKLGHVPKDQEHVPMDQGHSSKKLGHVPKDQEHVPMDQGHVPKKLGHVPLDQGHISKKLGHVPMDQEHVPKKLGHVPRKLGHVPKDWGHISKDCPNIPWARGHVPRDVPHTRSGQGPWRRTRAGQRHVAPTLGTSGATTCPGTLRTARATVGDIRKNCGRCRSAGGCPVPVSPSPRPPLGHMSPSHALIPIPMSPTCPHVPVPIPRPH